MKNTKKKEKIIEGDGKKEAGKNKKYKISKEEKSPGIRGNTDAHWKASQGYHHGDKSTTDTSRSNPSVGGPQGSGLSSVTAVRFPFICASPCIFKLLRSFLDSKVPFTHVLCCCDPIVGIVDLYILSLIHI